MMGKTPVATRGWEVLEVPGGWIRFNREKGSADGHCARHLNCKIDRRLARAGLGLVTAWCKKGLQDYVVDTEAHTLEKEVLSSEAGFDDRHAARTYLHQRAAAGPRSTESQLLALEKAWRPGSSEDEPRTIYCKSMLGAIGRAAAAAFESAAPH